MPPPRPRDRRDFEIALICALPLEADFVYSLFDKCWEEEGEQYYKGHGDQNEYTTGVIGEYNVVLVHMPGMGKVHAANVASSLRMSFPGIQLAIVVGVCGGFPGDNNNEIVLGDVIISQKLVQYDFGRQYPQGFEKKATFEDALSRPSPAIRSCLAKATRASGRNIMQKDTVAFLESLKAKHPKAKYPGVDADKLYPPDYLHQHHSVAKQDCACGSGVGTCSSAQKETCDKLQCDQTKVVPRTRLQVARRVAQDSHDFESVVDPMIHFGTVGTADTVLKDARRRNIMADTDGIIAFEMEGAGFWEYFPTMVIKGVCDYSDSHKNKVWQNYAAATAACCMKALLKLRTPEDRSGSLVGNSELFWHVPFGQLSSIVGRDEEVLALQKQLFSSESHRAAVYGLGGVGKSRIACEMANYARSCKEPYSVFWIQASSVASFEKDFLQIGETLNIPGFADEQVDRKSLVRQCLENTFVGKCLIILDSADDEAIWCTAVKQAANNISLLDYIPKRRTISLLVTTRSSRVAAYVAKQNMIHLKALNPTAAVKTLHSLMPDNIGNYSLQLSLTLVEQLSYLPLAIVQAAAYMNMNSVSIANYLELLADTKEEAIVELLSRDFEDESRYKDAQNSVASTWFISFKQLQLNHSSALNYLSFMSCLNEKDISQLLLPDLASKLECVESVGILQGYSFIQTRSGDGFQSSVHSMHRLVRLAMRNWLRNQDSLVTWTETVIERLVHIVLRQPWHETKELWKSCFPHAQTLCTAAVNQDFEAKYLLMRLTGLHLYDQGMYKDAVGYLSPIVSWREGRFEEKHESRLQAYADAGISLRKSGDLAGAETYLTRSYEGRREVLGAEHPDTLKCMTFLAWTYEDRGHYQMAEKLHKELLVIYTKHFGTKHVDTVTCMSNLASTYLCQGRLKEAEKLQFEAVQMKHKLLGPEHPSTLGSECCLAAIYYQQRQLKKATKLQIKVLTMHEQVLGVEHPDTLITMGNLALTYQSRLLLKKAEKLQLAVLEARKKVLGTDHFHTLTTMFNLAYIYRDRTQFVKAEGLHAEVLEIRKRVLGIEHPHTLMSTAALASVWYKQGRYEEAIQLSAACGHGMTYTWSSINHPRERISILAWKTLAAIHSVTQSAVWDRKKGSSS